MLVGVDPNVNNCGIVALRSKLLVMEVDLAGLQAFSVTSGIPSAVVATRRSANMGG